MVVEILALLAALLIGLRHATRDAEPVPVRIPAERMADPRTRR